MNDDADDGSALWALRHRHLLPQDDETAANLHQIAETEAELAATRARLIEVDRERIELIKQLPCGEPYRCVCGAIIDPFNAEDERTHRSHVFVAGLDQLLPR